MAEAFFLKRDADIVSQMEEEQIRNARIEEMVKVTGIQDTAVLGKLLDDGIDDKTLAAFGLIPIVAVAWADGDLKAKEKQAVLDAAADVIAARDNPAAELLERWLSRKPEKKLLELWAEYVRALGSALPPDDMAKLKSNVLNRARAVANAAGGFLGIGRISDEEQRLLQQLEKAFS